MTPNETEQSSEQKNTISVAARILTLLILFYRKIISPCLPKNCCRYTPSCSQYGLDALKVHGAVYGTWLIFKRLLRCSPFGGSGYDPVPAPLTQTERRSFYKKTAVVAVIVIACFSFSYAHAVFNPVITVDENGVITKTYYPPAVRFLRWIILSYKDNISPLLPVGKCRFTPTCSDYGLQAVEKHGAVKGGLLTLWRILRCNPWSDGGSDPVP